MNTGLAQIYSAYMPQQKKRLKRKAKARKDDGDVSANSGQKRVPRRLPSKEPVEHTVPRSGKSAEPQRLPRLPRLQSRTPDPVHPGGKPSIDRNASSSVDITLERLEKLQFKSITARSEWLSVQERKFALGFLNRHLLEVSMDEMDELMLDDKYEVLLHKHQIGPQDLSLAQQPTKLPPLRRYSPV